MASAGNAFRGNEIGSHLYIVITTPAPVDGSFAIVNLTSKRGTPGEDHACTLHAGEHPFIVHETLVRYGDACVTNEATLRGVSSSGAIQWLESVSPQMLREIQAGALLSRFTPKKIKIMVRTELDSSE